MNKTKIEWTDYTWNPVTGCDKISAGCRSCYAEKLANRFWGDRKFTDVQMHPERLNEPLEMWKKLNGKRIFVCDVSDLFHESVTFDFLVDIFRVFGDLPHTTFQLLTKRPERALDFLKWAAPVLFDSKKQAIARARKNTTYLPLKNVWIGVSCENQEQADKRIPLLLQIPASVRFLSCEPLIGKVNLQKWMNYTYVNDFGSHEIGWVIAGGESGHQARPMHPDWVRSLRDQCQAANVPFFFKQWGEWVETNQLENEKGECRLIYDDLNRSYKTTAIPNMSGLFHKMGKSKSGNLLDGKQHLEFPKP